jgi:membrane fusion protein (multidrug efflux system)
VPIYSEWIGTTQGLVNAEIKAQVTGYLLRQDYKEGLLVRKGELLFEIDPRPFQAALDQANAQVAQRQGELEQANSQVLQADAQVAQADSRLAEAQAQLASAEANLVKTQLDVDKYRPLVQEQAVTQQEYDNAVQANVVSRAQVDAAKAGVKSAQAQVAQSKAQIATAKAGVTTAQGQLENARAEVRTASLNLGFTRIISPIDGIAGIAQAQVGDLVSSTGPALTAISTVDPIKVYFTISEQEYLAFSQPAFSNAVQKDSLTQLQLELTLSDGSTFPQRGTFPNAYMFRLAAMRPMHGEKSKTRWTRISYKVFGPLLPLVRKIAPNAVITSEELGRAMIRLARQGAQKRVLENRDMIELGK